MISRIEIAGRGRWRRHRGLLPVPFHMLEYSFEVILKNCPDNCPRLANPAVQVDCTKYAFESPGQHLVPLLRFRVQAEALSDDYVFLKLESLSYAVERVVFRQADAKAMEI